MASPVQLKLPASHSLLFYPRTLSLTPSAAAATTTTRASWQLSEGYTDKRNVPFLPPQPKTKQPKSKSNSTTLSTPLQATTPPKETPWTISELLNQSRISDAPPPARLQGQQGKFEDLYLGYETWLPVAPKVKNPRSIYNALSLAYMGDCIYELYARRHFLFPPLTIDEYNDRVMAVVRCETQDALLKKLLKDDYLTEEERDVLRWGKNIGSAKTRTIKRVGVAVYSRASSLETLVGYLYLTNMERLEQLMRKLGFSTSASRDLIVEQKQ